MTVIGSKAVFRTNRNAPNYRVVKIDLMNPAEENWTTLINVSVKMKDSSTIVHINLYLSNTLQEDPLNPLLSATKLGGNYLMTVYLDHVKVLRNIWNSYQIYEIIQRNFNASFILTECFTISFF